MKKPDDFTKYWGKTSTENKDSGVHLLVYHCLDVAAVGKVLLDKQSRLQHSLAQLGGLEDLFFTQCMVFFLALHDLGKFAECFQNLRPDLLEAMQGKQSRRAYSRRHDTLGFYCWRDHVKPLLLERSFLKMGSASRRRMRDTAYDYWMRAITGHHGQPPQDGDVILSDFFSEQDLVAAGDFTWVVKDFLFTNIEGLPELDRSQLRTASWWLAGLTVLCDWIGSNSNFFPSCSHSQPLEEYWGKALEQAAKALDVTELSWEGMGEEKSLQALFGPDIAIPTPLQTACAEIQLQTGPHLFVLEDVTGAGKTEAAVLLAHRLMVHGIGTGIYFALPTMATANAMFERIKDIYRRLFSAGSLPSLVLAHSARNLSRTFRQVVLPVPEKDETGYSPEEETATAHCSAWLGDNPKKALLAAVGVGTVDQALLGILPSRHQGLRLLGLMDKILIADEVHACDEYMHTLLQNLLRAQAAIGGSVILLSATLSHRQRRELVEAFASGKQWNLEEEGSREDENGFPLITHLSQAGLRETCVDTRAEVRRRVRVEFLDSLQEVEEVLEQVITQGRCVCWVRNTVADARDAYRVLQARHPEWSIDLFHARFALGDRLAIEERIVRDFGKRSTVEQRRGRVLIATQVVEQSLDLDFDAMVTDLAPVDLIIQRAGRLCRHRRSREGERIGGPDERGIPVLHLLSPEPVDHPGRGWFANMFPRASWVYPNHGQLWLTARMLAEKEGFSVPEDVRFLTEGVFGEVPHEEIPEGLLERTLEAEGQGWAEISVAALNALKLDEGYSVASSNRWWDEARTPTRLGEPTISVYLGRWH